MFIFCNPNPCNILVGDCSIRACSIATDQLWNTTHKDICDLSRDRRNMPSANIVWGDYLQQKGFKQIPILLPYSARYTVKKFCYDDGYIGHSVKDRMIDRLERMMDEAKNDYERDEIRREIEEIRMKK